MLFLFVTFWTNNCLGFCYCCGFYSFLITTFVPQCYIPRLSAGALNSSVYVQTQFINTVPFLFFYWFMPSLVFCPLLIWTNCSLGVLSSCHPKTSFQHQPVECPLFFFCNLFIPRCCLLSCFTSLFLCIISPSSFLTSAVFFSPYISDHVFIVHLPLIDWLSVKFWIENNFLF